MRVFAILSALAVFAFANPAPLGFEIDKATYDEVTAKYRVESSIKTYTGGISISVDRKKVELDGLIGYYVSFDFDAQGKLVETNLSFEKNKFNELLSFLSKKYKLIKKTTSKYGETFVEFEKDNCIIKLRGLKEVTNLVYISKDEDKRREDYFKAQKQQQKEREQRIKENMNSL